MTTATYRNFTGTGAQLYERFFVPAIATPVSTELLATAGLRTGETVLDVACGTGVVTRAAAERVGTTGSVTAVDVSREMLDVAKATPAAGAPIEWHEADATALPLPDGAYDVALCQMGLMFIGDKAGAVAELFRVLTPGGRVVINTPGRIQPVFQAMEQAIVDHIDPGLGAFVGAVFSMHDPASLGSLLRDAGFDTVSQKEYVAPFSLPAPAELLWNYINLTPMGPLVAKASEGAKAAMENQFLEACAPHVIDGRIPVSQPVALAWAARS